MRLVRFLAAVFFLVTMVTIAVNGIGMTSPSGNLLLPWAAVPAPGLFLCFVVFGTIKILGPLND